MPKLKTLTQLNKLLKVFIQGPVSAGERLGSRTYGLGAGVAISLLGENVEAFDEAIDSLISSLPNVKGTLSKPVLLEELIPRVRKTKYAGTEFTIDEAEEFERKICELPLRKYRIVRRIFGVTLAQQSSAVHLGDFVIGSGRHLFGSMGANPLLALTMKPEEFDEPYIQYTAEARDSQQAAEIGDLLFYRFELIFGLLIGRRTKSLEVGILNYVGPQWRDALVLAEDCSVSHNSTRHGAVQFIPLDDPYFATPKPPFPRLFELISRENNELEKHVVRCAEWTGQALSDGNAASALVKGAIALEVLFSANEKGTITPSIMAQIAESCAFLLGNLQMPPREVEREVKRLYGVRSAVVHSGKDSVDEADLNSLIQICRSVIAVLLSEQDFAEVDTMHKLAEYFRRKKYASTLGEDLLGAKL